MVSEKEVYMKISEVQERSPQIIQRLLEVWESSVRTTHLFLSHAEIVQIRKYVPSALQGVEHLIIAADESGEAVAFMGIEKQRLEMLFLSPAVRGRGLGKRLMRYGIDTYGVRELTVNEQNPQAVGFYRHLGFETERRTELDEQGNPYPLLYMRLGCRKS